MLIFHECPNDIFHEVQLMTDGDYCLVHLMDENSDYRDLFINSRNMGSHIILDNSIFELGEAYNSERYYHWIKELKPTTFIIPDVLNDGTKTIENINNWFEEHPPIDGVQAMAVVQGNSYEELVETYRKIAFDPRIGKIGFSFDSHCYLSNKNALTREQAWMYGRIKFISMLYDQDIANKNKPHHLLGCSLPQEILYYRNVPWIESVDTSSPVINGILHRKYSMSGVEDKPSVKLFTLIDYKVSQEQLKLVEYNINMFRSFCYGY